MNKTYNCGWGYTSACNLKCKHCYNASGVPDIAEMSLEESKKVVQKLKVNGVESINYGTGECGLAKNFWQLVEYVFQQEILQGLTTNGWSINDTTIGAVKRCMNDVDVSIDYPNEHQHCEFRGHKDAWKFAINALNLLHKHNVNFSIVTCLHAQNCNVEIIDEFIKLVSQYECSWRINWFRPTGRGKNENDLKLNAIEVYNCFKYIVKKMKILALPDPYFAAMLGIKSTECPCGIKSFRITPTGGVVPCVYFTKSSCKLSIIDDPFDEIVNSEIFCQFRDRFPSFCNDCEYKDTCSGGCTSRAFWQSGTFNAPDSFCHKANNIAKNPFEDCIKDVVFAERSVKVHENYLCTAIFDGLKL